MPTITNEMRHAAIFQPRRMDEFTFLAAVVVMRSMGGVGEEAPQRNTPSLIINSLVGLRRVRAIKECGWILCGFAPAPIMPRAMNGTAKGYFFFRSNPFAVEGRKR